MATRKALTIKASHDKIEHLEQVLTSCVADAEKQLQTIRQQIRIIKDQLTRLEDHNKAVLLSSSGLTDPR